MPALKGIAKRAHLFHIFLPDLRRTRYACNLSASAMADDAMPPIRRFATPADMMQHLIKVR